MHIAIAGNIGAGKTSLVESLSNHFTWKAHYEDIEHNPYLYDFYNEMNRWSFNLQVYFLHSRFMQIIKIQESLSTVIQDRTIYEDAHIFAANLHDMGLFASRDFETYLGLFETICSLVKPPDMIIYLQASVPTLVKQIQKRGREYEANIRLEYLKRLNERYEAWASSYDKGKILKINVDDMDFVEKQGDLSLIIDKVNAELHGLF
jgi:deoxyadenosine/deoxycytidine kinase